MPKKNRDYTGLVRTPPSMAWLIRERAMLKGAIDKIDKQLERLPLERLRLEQELAALDRVIPRHEVKVDPRAIEGVRPQRPRLVSSGGVIKGILACLRGFNGVPVSTIEIAFYVARLNGLALTAEMQADWVKRVGKRLRGLRAEGVVNSFHDTEPGSQAWGMWALAAEVDRKAA